MFDTLLVRRISPPEALHPILAGRLLAARAVDCGVERFVAARRAAERVAHARQGPCYRLIDVHRQLAHFLGQSPDSAQTFTEAELACEAEALTVLPSGARLLAAARAAGRRIAFISDTPLPAAFLTAQLRAHGLLREGDALYASCEVGAHKRSGGLFRRAIADLGVRPSEVVHTGNDRQTDGIGAWRARVRSIAAPAGNATRLEAILESAAASCPLAAACAGAARLARDGAEGGAHERQLAALTAGVLAPVLTAFVGWILHRAVALGLRRVYFVSRDGQQLVPIAQHLVAALGLPVEPRYLYGSRLSWNGAVVDDTDAPWIWDHAEACCVRDLCQRIGLAPEDLAAPLTAAGVPSAAWEAVGDRAAQERLGAVLRSAAARPLIAAAAARTRAEVMAYLEQEGLFSAAACGFVDIGWRGSQHATLVDLAAPRARVRGFFFGLTEHEVAAHRDLREAYLFRETAGSGSRIAMPGWWIYVMESFCAADHATVVGFTTGAAGVTPVFGAQSTGDVREWGLPVVRRTVERFLSALWLPRGALAPWGDERGWVTGVLSALIISPTRGEAAAWGAFPVDLGQGREQRSAPLAAPYGLAPLVAALARGRRPKHHGCSWVAGGIALSPWRVRALYRTVEWLSGRRAAARQRAQRAVATLRAVAFRIVGDRSWRHVR